MQSLLQVRLNFLFSSVNWLQRRVNCWRSAGSFLGFQDESHCNYLWCGTLSSLYSRYSGPLKWLRFGDCVKGCDCHGASSQVSGHQVTFWRAQIPFLVCELPHRIGSRDLQSTEVLLRPINTPDPAHWIKSKLHSLLSLPSPNTFTTYSSCFTIWRIAM